MKDYRLALRDVGWTFAPPAAPSPWRVTRYDVAVFLAFLAAGILVGGWFLW